MQVQALKSLCAATILVLVPTLTAAQVARGRSAQELNENDQREQLANGKGWGAAHEYRPVPPLIEKSDEEEQASTMPRSDGMEPRGYVGEINGGPAQPIKYHGGPVMLGTTNVYFIWYGDWSTDRAAQNLLTEFASAIGGTRWYNINTTYKNKLGQHVSNAVHYAGHVSNTSTYRNLNDANVQTIVTNAIKNGHLPKDPHGVYFVLTAPGVKESSGFCTQYCGFHAHTNLNGTDIKYAFVGDPKNQCAGACEEQTTRSPNGDPAADGMASVFAHELSEAATDPDLNAWFDDSGDENADKCAWQFGTSFAATNGARANVNVGTREWLIQMNWVNATKGFCAKAF
jgi:hypothetical protein